MDQLHQSLEEISEKSLPPYLKKDILAFEKGIKNKSDVLDCLYNEVQDSNNSAYYDHQITKAQAALLRKKYLGVGGVVLWKQAGILPTRK